MKNKTLLIILISTALIMTACGSKSSTGGYNPSTVDKSDVTHGSNVDKTESTESTSENEQQNNPVEEVTDNLGEIHIVNPIDSVKYLTSGDDVVYNYYTYKGLSAEVAQIESPYTSTELINAIIRIYKPNSATINCELTNDSILQTEQDGVNQEELANAQFDSTVDGMLEGTGNRYYEIIKKRYNNEPVTWSISLSCNNTYESADEKKVCNIYGCKDYIITDYTNGEDIDIDMTELMMNDPNDLQTDANTKASQTEESQTEKEYSKLAIADGSSLQYDVTEFADSDAYGYMEVSYAGLYSIANKLQENGMIPGTKEEFVRDVVSSGFYQRSDYIVCSLIMDGGEDLIQSADSAAEETFGSAYRDYANSQGENVSWVLILADGYDGNNEQLVFGCNKYIIYEEK